MTALIMGKGRVLERSQYQPELGWDLEMDKGKNQSQINFPSIQVDSRQTVTGSSVSQFRVLPSWQI